MRNELSERLRIGVADRPAIPGLIAVGLLVAATVSGRTVPEPTWLWPACTAAVLFAILTNLARQDLWRRIQTHAHKQRVNTANALLNEHAPAAEQEPEIAGSIRDLGGQVERFGLKLDDLLAEVHAEKATDPRPRRS